MKELIQIVTDAFLRKPLYDLVAFEKRIELWSGRWNEYPHAAEFETYLHGKSWNMLEPEFLERHHDALAYLGPDAFAAVLPAYLVACIRAEDELTMSSYAVLDALSRVRWAAVGTDIFDIRVSHLTEQQCAAIARVLEQLAQSPAYLFSKTMIVAALDSYWRYVPVIPLDRLVDVVTQAFPRKPLHDPALFARRLEPGGGGWGGYLDGEKFQSYLPGKSWDMLESTFLEYHHDALCYFGPDAFAAVLPAYLVAFIRHNETLDMLPVFLMSALTRSSPPSSHQETFDVRVGRLSKRQRAAVVHVLEGLARSPYHVTFQEEIAAALDDYWRDVSRQSMDRPVD